VEGYDGDEVEGWGLMEVKALLIRKSEWLGQRAGGVAARFSDARH
jgi:hypothetical protein